MIHINLAFQSIWSIQSTFVLFGPIWSYSVLFGPFCPIWFYLVPFGPIIYIQSTLVLLGWLWPYSVLISPCRSISLYCLSTLVLFSPLRSFSVHFNSIRFIQFTLVHSVLFSLFCALWFYFGPMWSILSTSVLFDPIWSCSVYSVHSVHFGSNSVHIGPLQSYYFHFVLFDLIQSTLVLLGLNRCTSILFGRFRSYSVHFGFI